MMAGKSGERGGFYGCLLFYFNSMHYGFLFFFIPGLGISFISFIGV